MIREQDFVRTLANISRHKPEPLDDLIGGHTPPRPALSRPTDRALCPPTSLWAQPDETVTYIGIRVNEPIDTPEHLAARLCAAAVERQVVPIFLSHLASCEMLRFGFRVELIAGKTAEERAAAELQIQRMWNLAIIVDIADAAHLS